MSNKDDITVISEEYTKDNIKEIIDEYLDINDGDIIAKEIFLSCDHKQKILILLLGYEYIQFDSNCNYTGIDPVDISEKINVGIGTLYPQIRELEKKHLIENTGMEYRINRRSIQDVFKRI